MEIVDLVVEFPSGLSISDRATYDADSKIVHPSTRLATIMQDLGDSEAPPTTYAVIGGVEIEVALRIDGTFAVQGEIVEPEPQRTGFVGRLFGHEWTKEQRQQYGRFAHTLSAASLVGAVGYIHATNDWTARAGLRLAFLIVSCVVLFIEGIKSMNGE
ncbi:hypothetical protein [Burkholderia vietnamiensis]|uniref:hypothetical protein n=1 Tax=Burkholderia vietnamiensis TaxID=60552 RepID=UPI0007543EE9|nr:hypothetical protein [Burkholderia vietnamiensis]KVR82494.1 hypothetical protein WK26_11160 [Burkholderia vietnamiensis]